jgi:adenine-specific DNA-methyltransferase
MKPSKPVKTYQHKEAKRAHIPSAEEAGYEAASPKVAEAPDQRAFPRNPVVHRGQDPELFWMHKYGPDDTADRSAVDIRSLYRHEHVAPETPIKGLYLIFEHLKTAGVKTGDKKENAVFVRLDRLSSSALHAEGWYPVADPAHPALRIPHSALAAAPPSALSWLRCSCLSCVATESPGEKNSC